MGAAAILVGGAGRRLGGVEKHRLAWPGGGTVLERLIELLAREAGPVTLVSRAGPQMLAADVSTIHDAHPDRGPAAGVAAALSHAPSGWVFIAACDLPCLDAETIRALAAARGRQDVVRFRAGGYLQPLSAFWHTRCLPRVEAALLQCAPSLHGLVASLDATILETDDPRPFTNVNTPGDLAALGLEIKALEIRACP